MKHISIFIYAVIFLFTSGCEGYRKWDDGLPEMEHVYYIGFYKPNIATDYLSYEINKTGEVRWRYGASSSAGTWQIVEEDFVSIPFQLYSERIRSYDAISYFWINNIDNSHLIPGTDFIVTIENGDKLEPNSDGAYSLIWPETKKGIQKVRITRLTESYGRLRVNLYDPDGETPIITDLSTTIQNRTEEYEIRCMTQDNDRVTIFFVE